MMQSQRALAILVVFLSCLGAAAGQIITIKKVGDKTVTCVHSGLTSDLKNCGVRSDWYAYVFVGSISTITSIENDEKEIHIVPEEVFYGEPENPLTVLTSQALCLPKLAVGDQWLFFLRKEKGKPIVFDYGGNDSLPLARAQEQIETLRSLEKIGDFAILRGQVLQGPFFDRKVVPATRVVALRESDNAQFVATTDANGRYEFQPLPPGRYKITVGAVGSYQPDDSGVDLHRGACWDLTLSRSPHAQIGGHLKHSNGSPVPDVDVVLISSDDTWYSTTQADKNGQFMFDQLKPGQYVVGLNSPARPDWFNGGGAGAGVEIPPASLFYPGVANRSAAVVISLATDEKRDDIDFILPTQ